MNKINRSYFVRARGLTLLELLVVIGIIGILAALLFPVLGRVRSATNFTEDAANLRQIGAAALGYAGENNNTLPPAGAYVNGSESSWDMLLAPYLYTATVNTLKKKVSVIMSPLDPNANLTGRSYSLNRNLQGGKTLGAAGLTYGDPLTTPSIAFRLTDFPVPSQTILASARPQRPGQVAANFSCAVIDRPQQQLDADLANGNLFGGKFNYLMVSGNVQLLTPEETIGTGSLSAPNGMWTRDEGD